MWQRVGMGEQANEPWGPAHGTNRRVRAFVSRFEAAPGSCILICGSSGSPSSPMHGHTSPPSPQFDCAVFATHLDAILDGESDAVTSARAESHVNACPLCRQLMASALRYKQMMRRVGDHFRASGSLRDTVLATLRGVRGSRTR